MPKIVDPDKLGHILAAITRVNVLTINLLCDEQQKAQLIQQLSELIAHTRNTERAMIYAAYIQSLKNSETDIETIKLH